MNRSVSAIESISTAPSSSVDWAQLAAAMASAAQTSSTTSTGSSAQAIATLRLNSLIYTPPANNAASRLSQDYQSLQTALQLGELADAQQAFDRLRFDSMGSSLASSTSSLDLLA